MKARFIILLLTTIGLSSIKAQNIYKPTGCSGSSGPNVSTAILQHSQDRYQLVSVKWSDIETSPGVFSWTVLQSKINTVKNYNKKYALAVIAGGPGSPDWLMDSLNAPYMNYLFRGTISYRLPLWWDVIVQQRLSFMISALGTQFASDTSLALVYVTQMTANGIEGHLNGISIPTLSNNGFTATNWINAVKQTAYYYAASFPAKAIAIEVHDIDGASIIPSTIINDLYNDSSLCQRVGAALWWLSGKTTYQPNLLTVLQNFPGDKYAQFIARSDQPERFKDSSITTVFTQAKQLGVRYIEPWLYEYQNNTVDSLLQDFNDWSDTHFSTFDSCTPSILSGEKLITSAYNDMLIYPNPVTTHLTLKYLGEKQEIEVINMLGEVVLEATIEGTTTILTSNLVKGTYFISFKGSAKSTLKFIKR
ncbi:MAG: T9SS type A sorting domain-containing protein [Aureispira sp.]